jgi:hypothetical protein
VEAGALEGVAQLLTLGEGLRGGRRPLRSSGGPGPLHHAVESGNIFPPYGPRGAPSNISSTPSIHGLLFASRAGTGPGS